MKRTEASFTAFAILAAFLFSYPEPIFATEIECAQFSEKGDVKTTQETAEKGVTSSQTQTFDLNAKEGTAKLKGIQQKSPWTHEEIKIKDGKMQIISTCGEKGKTGTITVCVMLPSGKEACGIKIPKDNEKSPLIDSALTAASDSNPTSAMQRLALGDRASFAAKLNSLDPNLLAGKRLNVTDEEWRRMGVPAEYVGQVQEATREKPEQTQQLLQAIAAGNTREVKAILDKSSLNLVADTDIIARNAVRMYSDPAKLASALPAEARSEMLRSEYFCGIGEPCPESETPHTMRPPSAGFEESPSAPPVRSLASQPIPVTSSGKVDPVAFYAHAVKAAREGGLDGHVDPRLQRMGLLTTGSAEEWGRLYTMMAKQESGFSIYSTNPGECSHGVLQFCPGEYGLRMMSDVRNPELALQAVVKVTQQGQLFNYFGPLKRESNEVPQWAPWFERSVAPYADGAVPYTPITRSIYADIADKTGFIGFYTYGGLRVGAGQFFENTFGGGSSMFSGSGNLFGGSGGFLSSLFGLFSNQTPITFLPPALPPPPTVTVQGAVPTTPSKPAVKLISYPKEVRRGSVIIAIWSSVGVAADSCGLYEVEGEERTLRQARNAGTYTKNVPAVFSAPRVVFALECTPADSRVPRSEAAARLEIPVR